MGYRITMGDTTAATQLSPNYTLGDLTITSTGLPNLPSTQDQMNNLTNLAANLESLGSTINPFTVLSAFRTTAVENALSASGQPTAENANSGALSFHEEGLAVDLVPTGGMSTDEFFGRLCAIIGTSDMPGTWRDVYAEIAYKPSQNSIHLALAVPYKKNVFLSLNSSGTYTELTDDEVANYANPYNAAYGTSYPSLADDQAAGDDTSDDDSGDDSVDLGDPTSTDNTMIFVGLAALAGLAYYYFVYVAPHEGKKALA